MSVDLSQFYQVFIEESFEGLDAMETALMGLDTEQPDKEAINTVFRAAHSIKGGGATFGFTVLAEFTHTLETLLDQFRSGVRVICRNDVDLLLQSVDCMRELLDQLKIKNNRPTHRSESLKAVFEAILSQCPATAQATARKDIDTSDAAPKITWSIHFVPGVNILKTGNDPLRIFTALEDLGELQVKVRVDKLPPFAELDAECLYLSWELTLDGAVDEATIREQFEWVIDECDLTISNLSAQSESPPVQLPADAQKYAADNEKPLKKSPTAESSSIRVGIDKIDNLINMVGELVIIQSMLGEIGSDFTPGRLPKLIEGLEQLEQNTRELQESVMRIRMLPISFNFSRFPRMVRDLAAQLNKKIHLEMHGEQTELDKTVMEKIGDPLVHLVRNAVDHGIESPERRAASGKPETGRLTLNAYHQGGNVVIEISDDGAGLDREKILRKAQEKNLLSSVDAAILTDEQVYDLIFQPGFSTAETVSEVSGRGVGMDVVRRNIQALKGTVEIASRKGEGSTIRIRLPLTLAIMDGQLVRVGGHIYIFPLTSIVESMRCRKEQVSRVAGGCSVFRLRDEYVPVVELGSILNMPTRHTELEQSLMVVVETEGGKIGVVVDELLAQQQVVIKSLEQNYHKVEGISGATILGDGTVALIIDIPGIVQLANVASGHNISMVSPTKTIESQARKRA